MSHSKDDTFKTPSPRLIACFVLMMVVGWRESAQAQLLTQTKVLKAGWNAVFLEVEPVQRDPAKLFADTPVEVVAAFFPQTHPTTYIKNPGDAPWREEGWRVWYAPNREDGFLADLYAIHGNQAYLIYSQTSFAWSVKGA